MGETRSLKALAETVLRRDGPRDDQREAVRRPWSLRAVLLHSHRVGHEVWILRQPGDFDLIGDEVGDRAVFLADELPLLRGLDDAALRAVRDAKVAIPGSRLADAAADTDRAGGTPRRRRRSATGVAMDRSLNDAGLSALPTPEAIDALPTTALPALVITLSALLAHAGARLLDPPDSGTDRLIGVREAAAMLGMSEHWIYRHARRLPFTQRNGRRSLRFSESGIRKYLANARS
jgi:predicted DNA-binding transcriptional regulator AlpA